MVWQNWNLNLGITPKIRKKTATNTPLNWIPPSPGVFKLNFDGASKGNPGQAGFRGIIRNFNGEIQHLYFGSIGWDTNNLAELEGLWQGLRLTLQHNLFPIIIEGDYQILIHIANQLLWGADPNKVTHSWCLAARIDKISDWLHRNRVVSFTHVKREGNKVADFLANLGTESNNMLTYGALSIIHDADIQQNCSSLVHKDCSPPDAAAVAN